jgi:hypothetical protein
MKIVGCDLGGGAHVSGTDKIGVPHFSRSLREVGLSAGDGLGSFHHFYRCAPSPRGGETCFQPFLRGEPASHFSNTREVGHPERFLNQH